LPLYKEDSRNIINGVDFTETEKEICFTIEMPGIDKEEIQITDNILLIYGKRISSNLNKYMSKTYDLPRNIDIKKHKVTLENGILNIAFEKIGTKTIFLYID
jgi:HSP20 family molecular chaperone IbpA